MNYNGLKLIAEIDRVDFTLLDDNGFKVERAENDERPAGKRITNYTTHEQVFREVIQPALSDRKAGLPVQVKGIRPDYIEIALDVWGDKDKALAFVAELVANSKLPLPEVRAFLPFKAQREHARRKGEARPLAYRDEILETLQAGGSVYMGDQRSWCGRNPSPVSVRAYWKETDGQTKGEAKILPSKEHRARFEIIIQTPEGLSSVGLPQSELTDWASWTSWGVTKASKHFAQLIPEADPMSRLACLGSKTAIRPGKRMDDSKAKSDRGARRKKTGKPTYIRAFKGRANSDLNRVILNALKVLDRQLKKQGGGFCGLFRHSGQPSTTAKRREGNAATSPAKYRFANSATPVSLPKRNEQTFPRLTN